MLRSDHPKEYQFYRILSKKIGLASDIKVGSAMQTIKYPSNGDASDWMFAEKGIYAISAELGGATEKTANFFIEDPKDLTALLIENSGWIKRTMSYILDKVECKS
mgnify:CR=1 FL=1